MGNPRIRLSNRREVQEIIVIIITQLAWRYKIFSKIHEGDGLSRMEFEHNNSSLNLKEGLMITAGGIKPTHWIY